MLHGFGQYRQRLHRWKTCEGNSSSTYLGRWVKWMETTIHFQQKIRWILPDLWVKSFCLGLLPSASSHKEAAGSCGEGKEASAQYTRSTVAIWCVLPVLFFFFFQMWKYKKNMFYLEQSFFFLQYLLFGVSLTCLFFFVPCCIHSRIQTKWKQINFNAFSGKNKSTTGKPFLIKAFY